MAIGQACRNGLWFGTEKRMQWFPTPNRGADSSPQNWNSGGTDLNGGGYQFASFGSHKEYVYEWPSSSSRQVAQLMKSYADGTYGRGLIYFQDCTMFDTNVLPARVADPSIAIGYEGNTLVYGVQPSAIPTQSGPNNLPVTRVLYDLRGVTPGFRKGAGGVFVPIPDGYTLALGAFYSSTGTGGVYITRQDSLGNLGATTKLTELADNSPYVVQDMVSGVAGVWLWVGKQNLLDATVNLHAMIGRLIRTDQSQEVIVARNYFPNPNLVGSGTWAEVRRNRVPAPLPDTAEWFASWGTGGAGRVSVQNVGPDGSPMYEMEWTTAPTGGATRINPVTPSNRVAVTAGVTINVSALVASTLGSALLSVEFYTEAGYISGLTSSDLAVSLTPGASNRISVDALVPATAVWAVPRVLVRPANVVAGTFLWASKVMVDTAAPAGAPPLVYFDHEGMDPGVIQPEDFRVRATGTANRSASVMEIEQVNRLTGFNAVIGVSTRDGNPAARVIATSPTNSNSSGFFTIPTAPQMSGGVWAATVHQDAVIPPPLTSPAARVANIIAIQPEQHAPGQANSPGVRHQRLEYSTLTSSYNVHLYHGGRRGTPDIWFTDVGLYDPGYSGAWISGSSASGGTMRYYWEGLEDNSVSVKVKVPQELVTARSGPWLGGQGHSGARFMGMPTYIQNTGVNGGQVGFAASFREVGSWTLGG